MDWFPSLNAKITFLAFGQNCRTYIPEILYDTKTDNFTSGVDNCASKICKFFLCACADLLLNGEMATVSTCFRKLKFWLWLLWTVFHLKQAGF